MTEFLILYHHPAVPVKKVKRFVLCVAVAFLFTMPITCMNRKKVLIIDDETDFCFLLKTYLLKKNYNIFLANTLQQGMQLLESETPDIIFLDNNLPDGLGWDRIDYISNSYPFAELNLISAYQSTIPEPVKLKFNVWEKPLDLQRLDEYL